MSLFWMPWLAHALTVVAALAYLAAGARLVCFSGSFGVRSRRGVSFLAGLVVAALLCAGLELLLSLRPVSFWQALLAVLLCLMVYRSRGNLAALLRSSR